MRTLRITQTFVRSLTQRMFKQRQAGRALTVQAHTYRTMQPATRRGTQTGKMFRMRGKGIRPVRGRGLGDLICRVVVETPVNLTDDQKELFRRLDDTLLGGGSRHNPQSTGWLDGVKKFFEGLGF